MLCYIKLLMVKGFNTPMFQFSKKAQADAEEVQDLTEEQLLEIAGGKSTHKTTHKSGKGSKSTHHTGHSTHHTGHSSHHGKTTTKKHH